LHLALGGDVDPPFDAAGRRPHLSRSAAGGKQLTVIGFLARGVALSISRLYPRRAEAGSGL